MRPSENRLQTLRILYNKWQCLAKNSRVHGSRYHLCELKRLMFSCESCFNRLRRRVNLTNSRRRARERHECASLPGLSAHIAIQIKWKHTRTSDTVAGQAHEDVICHTAAYRVHRSLGRVSYRTSQPYGPDHCKK